MILSELLQLLPDNYAKGETSNNYKTLKILAVAFEEMQETLERIQLWRDIDEAQGTNLDKIGVNVGQPRNGHNDDQYRMWLKIKILMNKSDGELESINGIMSALAGDSFIGIQEMWSVKEHPKAGEPAAILLFVDQSSLKNLPYEAIKRVTAGGISVYFQTMESTSMLEFTSGQTIVHISTYQACGTFSAGGEYEL